MERLHHMNLIWLLIGAMLLAGALFAFSGSSEGWGKTRRFIDKDVDGEPDEPKGPADGI
ncbi:hypothetical protein [Brevundimonas sp.]|uniref:hypothetical protein n=1 Tax=Brevundimonas sp. TaxID=1871086 RepID=UPI001ACD7C22|nr:hypothetical protein [Brevundimonas sp.]MBN9467027.1 hypothetical protein [Brevundimonas sp.]